MFFDQAGVEAIVTGGHGRMGREDSVLGDAAQRRGKRFAVAFHALPRGLQGGKGAVAFVEVVNARLDPQRIQGADPAHAGHQFLTNANPLVAAIEPCRQGAVLGTIALDVAVQQVQVHAATRTTQTLANNWLPRVEIETVIGLPSLPQAGCMGRSATWVCRYSSSCQPSALSRCRKYPWL